MSKLKIQTLQIISPSVPADDSQPAEASLTTKDSSSGSAQQLQDARQAVEVAKSRLGEIQTMVYFNPKELSVDKLTQLLKSTPSSDLTTEADTTSDKDRGILYNGHAGLGSNE